MENIARKGEIACIKRFLLSSQCFPPYMALIFHFLMHFNPLSDDKIFHSSKLKEFADDDFKFAGNGRKLSKRVENTVGKGEIACYEQFLRFPQCFSKGLFPRGVKRCHCVGMG